MQQIQLQPSSFTLLVAISAFFLLVGVKKYKDFSFLTHWISNLGEWKTKSRIYFSASLLLIGALGIDFLQKLSTFLPNTIFLSLGILSFYGALASLVAIVFLPIGRNTELHMKIGAILYRLFINLALIALIFPLATLKSTLVIVLTLTAIFFTNMLSVSGGTLYKKYGEIPINLTKVRNKEKSFVTKNATIWEWLTVVSLLVWVITVNTILG